MEIQFNNAYIDLQNLINISKGDKNRMLKYLNQFQELIPPRVESLKTNMAEGDRKMIRQILHQMSPQLQFFGIPEVVEPILLLEHNYKTMSLEDMNSIVTKILMKLEDATKEVTFILKKYF